MKELKSQLDKSVNFVEDNLKGFIESRYVRRAEKYFVCYLSSQSGCNKGCKFCHLTATKQTTFEDVGLQGFLDQAAHVFDHYLKEPQAKHVHYNFMARGEALSNQYLLEDADSILYPLGQLATKHNLNSKFNLSTIIPKNINKSLTDIFRIITPTIYYSIYSTNESFRKQWLPMAMPVKESLELLKEYQSVSKKIIKIHFAFIKGQNDSLQDMENICQALSDKDIVYEFNVVRYNPFSKEQGEESDEETINRNVDFIKSQIGNRVKVISRVGLDVFASCGLFVDKKK